MFKRWCKRFLVVVAVLAVLLVLFLVVERVRGQVSLARYKKALIAQGEKLTARELQATGENGAPAVLDAMKRLSNGFLLPQSWPPRMALMPSGRAVVCFREPLWIEKAIVRNGEYVDERATNRWEQLATDLKTNEAALADIRAGLEKPVLSNKLDLSRGHRTVLPHLGMAKSLAFWLAASSQLALREGHAHAALPDLLAQARLPRLLAEDHLLISELVRIIICGIAKTDTWEALQADGWTEGDLAALQSAWADQSFATTLAGSLEGERSAFEVSYRMVRESNEDAVAFLFGLEQFLDAEGVERPSWERFVRTLPCGEGIAEVLKTQIYSRLWRFAWSHQDQQHDMEHLQHLIQTARTLPNGKSFALAGAAVDQLDAGSRRKNFYDRLRYPDPLAGSSISFCGSVSKTLRAETDRSMTLCAIALKRYSLRHGKLPSSLDALVPEFVSAVPVDYMDGQPLRYRLNADGTFLLYSVGENLTDDGGDTSPLPDHAGSRNLWFKKDYVWPAPATSEEVESYRREAVKK